jgi:hypothetical protein
MNLKISKTRVGIIITFGLLMALNVFFATQYYLVKNEIKVIQKIENTKKVNAKVVAFARLFIEKVLKAKTEVSFEDRLKLENVVRDLGDEEILSQWEKFTASKTEIDAQQNVKDLLGILMNKIAN